MLNGLGLYLSNSCQMSTTYGLHNLKKIDKKSISQPTTSILSSSQHHCTCTRYIRHPTPHPSPILLQFSSPVSTTAGSCRDPWPVRWSLVRTEGWREEWGDRRQESWRVPSVQSTAPSAPPHWASRHRSGAEPGRPLRLERGERGRRGERERERERGVREREERHTYARYIR